MTMVVRTGVVRRGILGMLPIVGWVREYRPAMLRGDLLAGLVVAALAIPQSMGYAAVAGVGVEVGLYTLPPALLAYAIFGSSRLLVVGPVSTVSLLSGSLVGQLSGGDPVRAAALTSALAMMAGVGLVAAGLFRVGWVAEFLSEPIVAGFITGLVVLVVLGQAPVLLGVHSGKGGVIEQAWGITHAVGHEHPATVAVAVVALAVLFGGHRLLRRVPWSLLVLVGGIAGSRILNLHARGVATIGHVPSGLPRPVLPMVAWGDLESLVTGALAVALVGLAEGLAAARLFAREHNDRVNADQELVAHGMADIAAGIFSGMGAAGSLSKTAASERVGGRSQVVGVVAAVSVVLVMLFASGTVSALPSAVLAAIVVHAVWGLLKPKVFGEYWRIRSNDGIAAVVAMVGVLVLGPLLGLLVAIGQSLLGLVYRTTQVHIDEMGKLPEEKAAWGSLTDHPERHTVSGILVLRLDAPLFWANAATVFDRLLELVLSRPDVHVVLLDLEATNQLDATTERRLESFLEALRAHGKELYLVRIFHQVRVVMKASGFFERLGEGRAWHSISAAVQAAKAVVAVQEAFQAAALEWSGPDSVRSAAEPGDEGAEDSPEWIAPREFGDREAAKADRSAGSPGRHPVTALPVQRSGESGTRPQATAPSEADPRREGEPAKVAVAAKGAKAAKSGSVKRSPERSGKRHADKGRGKRHHG
jgi:high affinity sulfate transporter 1